jgi:hypothetical protein
MIESVSLVTGKQGSGAMKFALKVTGIIFALLAGIAIILLLIINYFFFSTNHLPKGDFMTEAISPNGDYTVCAYLSNGGATVAFAVRGEVVYHNKRNKSKNIYWEYREDQAEIVWIDNNTVSINGVELDVRKDVYDWRKQ